MHKNLDLRSFCKASLVFSPTTCVKPAAGVRRSSPGKVVGVSRALLPALRTGGTSNPSNVTQNNALLEQLAICSNGFR